MNVWISVVNLMVALMPFSLIHDVLREDYFLLLNGGKAFLVIKLKLSFLCRWIGL